MLLVKNLPMLLHREKLSMFKEPYHLPPMILIIIDTNNSTSWIFRLHRSKTSKTLLPKKNLRICLHLMKFKGLQDVTKMLTDLSISQTRVKSPLLKFKDSSSPSFLKIWALLPILLIILNSIARQITSNRSLTFAVNNPLKSTMKTRVRQWWSDWWSASDLQRTLTSTEFQARPLTSRISKKSCQCPAPASSLSSSSSETHILTLSARPQCTHVTTLDVESSSRSLRVSSIT